VNESGQVVKTLSLLPFAQNLNYLVPDFKAETTFNLCLLGESESSPNLSSAILNEATG